MSSNLPYNTLASGDSGAALPVAWHEAMFEVGDEKVDAVPTIDLLLHLVPFDVVERYREAHRRCGYTYNP